MTDGIDSKIVQFAADIKTRDQHNEAIVARLIEFTTLLYGEIDAVLDILKAQGIACGSLGIHEPSKGQKVFEFDWNTYRVSLWPSPKPALPDPESDIPFVTTPTGRLIVYLRHVNQPEPARAIGDYYVTESGNLYVGGALGLLHYQSFDQNDLRDLAFGLFTALGRIVVTHMPLKQITFDPVSQTTKNPLGFAVPNPKVRTLID